MADLATHIASLITPSLADMGYELIRVQLSGTDRPRLQIMAEPSNGRQMTVDDCERISRQLAPLLEVEDPVSSAYVLEISSPGIDRPLTRPQDYVNWAGHLAKIELLLPIDGRRRLTMIVAGLADDVVRLQDPDDEAVQLAVPFANIAKGKLVLTDALLAAAAAAAEEPPQKAPARPRGYLGIDGLVTIDEKGKRPMRFKTQADAARWQQKIAPQLFTVALAIENYPAGGFVLRANDLLTSNQG